MQKTILTYGLIAGAIVVAGSPLNLFLDASSEHLAALEWLGYAVMIVAFSVIFIGIKGYRDNELGGVIGFGTAFLIGFGITLVASVFYVVGWEINLAITDYAFINDYTQALIQEKQASGVSEERVAFTAEMNVMTERYANPLFRVPITLLEILPVGLLITLVSSAVLRNSRVLPAA